MTSVDSSQVSFGDTVDIIEDGSVSVAPPRNCWRCKASMPFNYMFCTQCGNALTKSSSSEPTLSTIESSGSSKSRNKTSVLRSSLEKKELNQKTGSKKVKTLRSKVLLNESNTPKEVLKALNTPLNSLSKSNDQKKLEQTLLVAQSLEFANAQLMETLYQQITREKSEAKVESKDRQIITQDEKMSYTRRSDYLSDSIEDVTKSYEKTVVTSTLVPQPEMLIKDPSISFDSTLKEAPDEENHAWLWGDVFNRSGAVQLPNRAASPLQSIASRISARSRVKFSDHSFASTHSIASGVAGGTESGNMLFWGNILSSDPSLQDTTDSHTTETEVRTTKENDTYSLSLSKSEIENSMESFANQLDAVVPASSSIHTIPEIEKDHHELDHGKEEEEFGGKAIEDSILSHESEDEILSKKCNANLRISTLFINTTKQIKDILPKVDQFIDFRRELSSVERTTIDCLMEEQDRAKELSDFVQTTFIQQLQKEMSHFQQRANLQRTIIGNQISNLLLKTTQLETYFREEFEAAKQDYEEYLSHNPVQQQQYQANPDQISEEMTEIQTKANEVLGDISIELKRLMERELELTGLIKQEEYAIVETLKLWKPQLHKWLQKLLTTITRAEGYIEKYFQSFEAFNPINIE